MQDYFFYDHLPAPLAKVSKPFCDLAHQIMAHAGDNPGGQWGVALQRLLEAKDAAVRATISEGALD